MCTTALNTKTKDVTLNVILNKDFGRRIELIKRWPIDIGITLTQTELKKMKEWLVDIGAVPKTQTNRKMVDRYRYDPEL